MHLTPVLIFFFKKKRWCSYVSVDLFSSHSCCFDSCLGQRAWFTVSVCVMAGQSNLVSAHMNKEKHWKHTPCLQGFSGSNSCYWGGFVRLYATVAVWWRQIHRTCSWFKQKIKPIFKHRHLILMDHPGYSKRLKTNNASPLSHTHRVRRS